MAQFIKPPGYGEPQFRPTLSERLAAKRSKKSAAEKREGNDAKYLELIRQLPCCITGRPGPNDPHHLMGGPAHAERGVGRRATDRWAVPICRVMHETVQPLGARREEAWFREHGIENIYELANALYHAPRNLEIMTNIILAHRTR